MELTPPLKRIEWAPCWRIISSRYPPVELFERVASAEDFDAVHELESLTNDRIREETGQLPLVDPRDRVYGPGAGYIMAAFTHLNPFGSRFSDGTYGVYYAARDLETAIAETKHHREAFLRHSSEAPITLQMRVLVARLAADLHDLRSLRRKHPALYDKRDYAAGQALGRTLREEGSWGVVYHSVRHKGGQCAGAFRPRALSHCTQERHLAYHWNGRSIHVTKLS